MRPNSGHNELTISQRNTLQTLSSDFGLDQEDYPDLQNLFDLYWREKIPRGSRSTFLQRSAIYGSLAEQSKFCFTLQDETFFLV